MFGRMFDRFRFPRIPRGRLPRLSPRVTTETTTSTTTSSTSTQTTTSTSTMTETTSTSTTSTAPFMNTHCTCIDLDNPSIQKSALVSILNLPSWRSLMRSYFESLGFRSCDCDDSNDGYDNYDGYR